MKKLVAAVAALGLLSACLPIKIGRDFSQSAAVDSIRPEQSRKADVIAALGEPWERKTENGEVVWTYLYVTNPGRPGTIASAHARTRLKRFEVRFDGDVVKTVKLELSENPPPDPLEKTN